MKKLKISSKLRLGFGIIILLMAVCTVVVIISNTIVTRNLNHIDSKSIFQSEGTDLSDAFHGARLNARILMLQPNDDAYEESIKYLYMCDDIILNMKKYIVENPILKRFREWLNNLEDKINEYRDIVEELQISNTILYNDQSTVIELGESLTEFSDILDVTHISTLYESVSSDISANLKIQQLDDLKTGAKISQGIWNMRASVNLMIQYGNSYTGFENDLEYINYVINLVENNASHFTGITEVQNKLKEYKEHIIKFRDEMKINDTIVENLMSKGIDMLDSLNSMMRDIDGEMVSQIDSSKRHAVSSLTLVVTAAVISLVAAVFMAGYIRKSIVSVLSKSAENIEDVSNTVAVSSKQISDSSLHLADDSGKQAASIEETSATMNQTAAMVRQTRDNTSRATDLSNKCEQNASKGMKEVTSLIEIMENLNSSSNEINNIVDTINSIASQINILALNTSVEAARAGEAGRSFSVVAEEVRNLASKSAEAVSDTSKIIDKNISLTEQGTISTKAVSNSLNVIFDDVHGMNTLLTEISAASEEQSRGIDQINIAISKMEKITQSSAAIARETSASAGQMLSSSRKLVSATGEISELI